MTGAAYAVVLTLGAVLAGVVGLEVRGLAGSQRLALAAIPSAAPAVAPPVGLPAGDLPGAAGLRAQWAETVQARPLFARDRRPASRPVAAGAGPLGMPRLTGVVVYGAERSAILVPAGGGKPVVAREGMQVGGVVVQAIRAGQVTVSGPDGSRVLRPSYDARPPAPPAVQPLGLTGVPTTGLNLSAGFMPPQPALQGASGAAR